jgi:lipopolysaccharide/colanic/teichoic acid biosynthesis glycosyltransferase
MLKRSFDILASLFGLAILWPFFLVIAVLIKLDSSGPVFFRQERVGLNGRIFKIHKFRTMKDNAENEGSLITAGADRRITGIGRTLRKFKIDELPQLIDVLVGDMSLVGPRPEVPEYVKYYPDGVKEKILSARPGITDISSIQYINEGDILGKAENPHQAYINDILPKKLEYYLDYVDHASFLYDIKIIMKTIWFIGGQVR